MTEKSQDRPRRQNRQQAGGSEKSQDRPKRQNRQYVVELEESGGGRGLMYALGTIGGLAIGAMVLRGLGLREAVETEGSDEAEPPPAPRRTQPGAQFRPVG